MEKPNWHVRDHSNFSKPEEKRGGGEGGGVQPPFDFFKGQTLIGMQRQLHHLPMKQPKTRSQGAAARGEENQRGGEEGGR